MSRPKLFRHKPATQGLPGERIYAIGDIHGRFDLYQDLMARIDRDLCVRPALQTRYVVLGDMIDRGSQSNELLTHLSGLDPRQHVILMGNHEAALLDTLHGDHDAAELWVRFGGLATLASFGVPVDAIDIEDSGQVIACARAAIPGPLAAWLADRPKCFSAGGYFFAHAGVRPGVALDRQTAADLLWIRDAFTLDESLHGAIIVHGHSIHEAGVEIRPNRIGVDTGAYRTGCLSAVGLEDDKIWTIATGARAPVAYPANWGPRISEGYAAFGQ